MQSRKSQALADPELIPLPPAEHTEAAEVNSDQATKRERLTKFNVLVGGYINLEYRLPNGNVVKFLDDATHLGNQLECEFGGDRGFGIAANMDFSLICTYGENGENPELVAYKKR